MLFQGCLDSIVHSIGAMLCSVHVYRSCFLHMVYYMHICTCSYILTHNIGAPVNVYVNIAALLAMHVSGRCTTSILTYCYYTVIPVWCLELLERSSSRVSNQCWPLSLYLANALSMVNTLINLSFTS